MVPAVIAIQRRMMCQNHGERCLTQIHEVCGETLWNLVFSKFDIVIKRGLKFVILNRLTVKV